VVTLASTFTEGAPDPTLGYIEFTATVIESSPAFRSLTTWLMILDIVPIYAFGTIPASIDEGSAGTFNVNTTNVPDGTTLYWVISTNAGDFLNDQFTGLWGPFTIVSNTGSFTVTPIADEFTEGLESFQLRLQTGYPNGLIVAMSNVVFINDTSQTPVPTYTLTPAANNVDEGSSLTFNVSGTNITNGTYYWTIEDNTVEFSIFSGSFTITSNSGSFSVTPTADGITEGAETFTASIRSGSTSGTVLATSTSVTINDIAIATAPSSITLSVGSVNPVGGVTNVAIPAVGGTDTTGAVTGWVASTASNIRFTVVDGSSATSTITINGDAYTSGNNFTITAANNLSIVVTTSETNRATVTRTFTISVVGDNNLKILLVTNGSFQPAWVNNVRDSMTAVASSYAPYTFTITTSVPNNNTLPTVSVGQYDVIWFFPNGNLAWNPSFKTVNDAGTGLITSLFLPSMTGVPTNVLPVDVNNWDTFGRTLVYPSNNTHPISIGNGSANQSVHPFTYTGYCSDFPGIMAPGGSIVVLDPTTPSNTGSGPDRTIVAVKDSTSPVGRTVYLNVFPVSNAPGGYSSAIGGPGGWDYATQGVGGGRLFINACLWAARKI
jgi:hypothetical protein